MSPPIPESPILPKQEKVLPAVRATLEHVPRTVRGLSVVSLFNDFASEMVYPLLPAFLTGSLGAGPLILGVLDGASDLTSAALKLVSGRLSDRPRWRRSLILAGYATAVLVRPLMAVADAAWQVVGLRVVDRAGKGLRTPPRDALIAAVTPAASRGRAFGFHRGADHLGAVLGSLVAWYLLARGLEVRQVIGWSLVPGVIALALLVVILGHAPVSAWPPPDRGGRQSLDATGRVFWGPVLVLAGLAAGRLPEALLLLHLQGLGVSVTTIPLAWAGLHVIRSASSYPGGWLSDWLGPRRVVAAGSLLFGGVVLALAGNPTPTAALAIFLLLGPVAGLTEPAERALVAHLAPVRTGRGFGVYHAVLGLAAVPAGLAFGAIYQYVGGGLALAVSAAAVTTGALGWLAVSRNRAT